MKTLLQRIEAWLRRQAKARNSKEWLARWNKACQKSWENLNTPPPSAEKYFRFERAHHRLCRLAKTKFKLPNSL